MFRKRRALRSIGLDRELEVYLDDHNGGEPAAVDALRQQTDERFGPTGMNIGHTQGRFLQFLAGTIGARRVVEVGTFTGVSTLYLAWGVGPLGHVDCFERDPEPIELARNAWRSEGVDDRVTVHIGDARSTLTEHLAEHDAPIDLAFIDADKRGYAEYVELLFPHLRPGGLLVIDNTLWGGAVIRTADQSADTKAIRDLNEMVTRRFGTESVLVPVGDGMTMIRRDEQGATP